MIVSWTYVTDNRGFVETYQVMYGEGLFKTVSNSINTIVIGGLDPGTVYTIRIAVINSEGIIGEWSDPVTHESQYIICMLFKSNEYLQLLQCQELFSYEEAHLNHVHHGV